MYIQHNFLFLNILLLLKQQHIFQYLYLNNIYHQHHFNTQHILNWYPLIDFQHILYIHLSNQLQVLQYNNHPILISNKLRDKKYIHLNVGQELMVYNLKQHLLHLLYHQLVHYLLYLYILFLLYLNILLGYLNINHIQRSNTHLLLLKIPIYHNHLDPLLYRYFDHLIQLLISFRYIYHVHLLHHILQLHRQYIL